MHFSAVMTAAEGREPRSHINQWLRSFVNIWNSLRDLKGTTTTPSSCVCGQSTASRRNYGRLLGAADATVGEFPWMVSIYTPGASGDHICGGALITDRHVLTAADCASLVRVIFRIENIIFN